MDVIDPTLRTIKSLEIEHTPQTASCQPVPILSPHYQHSPDATHTQPTPVQHYPAYLYDIPSHVDHPGCPTSLDCLPSTFGHKPTQTLPILVRAAILGSPQQRLTSSEIYTAVEQKFPYFQTAKEKWKGSIRHNLSLNAMFTRIPRPDTKSGLGAYWIVNTDVPLSRRCSTSQSRISSPTSSASVPAKSPSVATDETPVAGPSSANAVPEENDPPLSNSVGGGKRGHGRPRGRGRGGSRLNPLMPKRTVPARAASSKKRNYAQLAGQSDEIVEDESADYVLLEGESDEEKLSTMGSKRKGKGKAIGNKRARSRKTDAPDLGLLPHATVSREEATINRLIANLAETHREHTIVTALSMRLADKLTDVQADNARDRAGIRRLSQMVDEERRLRSEKEIRLVLLQRNVTDLDSWRLNMENGSLASCTGTTHLQRSYRAVGDGNVISQAMSSELMDMSGEDLGSLVGGF